MRELARRRRLRATASAPRPKARSYRPRTTCARVSLLPLSANSPFWQGHDARGGRAERVRRSRRTGLPRRQRLRQLRSTASARRPRGAIPDPTFRVVGHPRPQPNYSLGDCWTVPTRVERAALVRCVQCLVSEAESLATGGPDRQAKVPTASSRRATSSPRAVPGVSTRRSRRWPRRPSSTTPRPRLRRTAGGRRARALQRRDTQAGVRHHGLAKVVSAAAAASQQ